MSLFEERCVRVQLGGALEAKTRKKFLLDWDTIIDRRSRQWLVIREKERQSTYPPQLDWVSGCCEYTMFLEKQVHNLKGEKGANQKLDPIIPWLGPKFIPPTYISQRRRQVSPDVKPDIAYLKALTILHPVFFEILRFCPRCNATGSDITWGGWTTSGPRDVHGVSSEEMVIGVQMQCKKCKAARGKANADDNDNDPSYCWGTASHQFWERKQHWEIPVPHILWRSAVTSELYNLIIELRPSLTSTGLSEHIKQLHLLEYHKRRREYLTNFEARAKQQAWPMKEVKLQKFSEPHTGRHQEGYDNTSISDELVTDIYLGWSRATRQRESEESLQTKTGVALSIDATFRTASKATVVDKGKTHTCIYKGRITTVLNEETLILAWRFCFTQGNWELQELLKGVKRRLELLGVSDPDMVISDCCCHVSKAIHEVFPDAVVCLDVWHLLICYLVCLVGGSKCPVRGEVARDIVDAILKCRVLAKTPALCWNKTEQEMRLEAAFRKWDAKGVWTAAGMKAHQEQLGHVRKGCLSRPREDVRADSSRIEGSHKGWNSLQRSFSSGIEMMVALGHDFVLRHNTHVESALKQPSKFTSSTFGSHHVRLVNDCAVRWNTQLARKDKIDSGMEQLPVLNIPQSGETFGMMKMSPETAAHQSLASIKKEPINEEQELLDLSSQDLLDASHILSEVGVDPSLLYQLPQASVKASGAAVQLNLSASSSTTPHPCTRTHDSVPSVDASPPFAAPPSAAPPSAVPPSATPLSAPPPSAPPPSALPLLLSSANSQTLPIASSSRPDDVLPTAFQYLFQIPPNTTPSPSASTPTPGDVLDVDAPYDPDSRDQKMNIIHAALEKDADQPAPQNDCADRKGKSVDRKGKGVDRSAVQTQSQVKSARKHRADKSSDNAHPADVIEILSESEEESEPPPRKKLRLHVPGTTAAAKAAKVSASVPTLTSQTAAPSASMSGTLDTFLQPKSQSSAPPVVVPETAYFPKPNISGFTRSQRVFSVASGVDAQSLSFASADFNEFKLFLNMRLQCKWITYNMSPYHWVCAASAYNRELDKLNQATLIDRPLKTPRALMDKLYDLEMKLIACIVSENYESHSGRIPAFWRPHCHAFPLQVGGKSGSQLATKLVNGKKISVKVHTCHRCKRIMYPGPVNSPLNHSRGVCSDEVWQSARVEKEKANGKVVLSLEDPPLFPQPEKLFTTNKDGHQFHADRLFKLLGDFYIRVIAGVAGSGPNAMYDVAFAQLLQKRVTVLDASPTSPTVVLFKPYHNVKTVGMADGQAYSYGGEEWIRLDCLSVEDTNNAPGTPAHHQGQDPGPSMQPLRPGPSDAGPSSAVAGVSESSGSSRAKSPSGWQGQDIAPCEDSPEPGTSHRGSSEMGT